MTPKEKARELAGKFTKHTLMFDRDIGGDGWFAQPEEAKQCASICVEEIIKALQEYDENTEGYLKEEGYISAELQNMESDFRYWSAVKQEILNYED